MSARSSSGLRRGVTVIGNVALDRVNGASPTPGGCPSFAPAAFAAMDVPGAIVTQLLREHRNHFSELRSYSKVPVTLLDATSTSCFDLRYSGDDRTVAVEAIGSAWTPDSLERLGVDTQWIHLGALQRSDFPLETLRSLSSKGHQLSYDGQGLVRAARVGPLRLDAAFDPGVLRVLSILKLGDEEAAVLAAGGEFGVTHARALGVPETLVTFGSGGCHLYVGGEVEHVPAAWEVPDVHATGAGDVFTASYVMARANGAEPVPAARWASGVVAEMLEARRSAWTTENLSAKAGIG